MTKKPKDARTLAFGVLLDVFENGAYANLALDKALFSCDLAQRDRSLATELVYGTVKYKLRLEYIIDQVANPKTSKMDPQTYTLLLLSVYQLDALTRIPDRAVVHEAVELAKTLKLRSSKFINAVLRQVIRALPDLSWPDQHKQRIAYLSKWYSFPQWMVELWHSRFGYQRTVALCEYFNAPAPLWVRTNTMATTPAQLRAAFQAEGIQATPSRHVPEGILLEAPGDLRSLKTFQEGAFIVQNDSSMLVGHALDPQKDEDILDLCAAPGGKTTHIATLMENTGQVTAADIHPHRVELINENRTRLALSNIHLEVADATKVPSAWHDRFDRVLLDAPCSGLGVLNRRADSRWQKRKGDIPAFADLQALMLDQAALCVRPGGMLVYSTCTLTKEENSLQVEEFLQRHSDFFPADHLDQNWQNLKAENGQREIVPDVDGMDGFFIAGMIRRATP